MTIRYGRAAAALALVCALAACGDSPNDPSPVRDAEAARVELVQQPDSSNSGESTTLAVRVLAGSGAPIAGADVTLEPQQGSVAESSLVTDDAGRATIAWLLADIDARQTLRVRSGDATLDVAVTSRPRAVSLAIQNLDATLAFGDTTAPLVVSGVTVTGRTVTPAQPVTIALEQESRRWMDMPVASVSGRRIAALGPGTVAVRVSSAGVSSDPFVLEVPALPIVRALTPAQVPADGGVVVIDGYDLQLIDDGDLLVDGDAGTIASRDDSSIRLHVGPAPTSCHGRDAVALTIEGAHSAIGPLTVRRARAGSLALEVGAIHRLGRTSDLCLRLPAIPGAEYVIGWFDGRGVESAARAPEDQNLQYVQTRIGMRDQSVESAFSNVASRAASRAGTSASGDDEIDIVRVETTARSSAPQATTWWYDRATPWAPGDTFALRDDTGQAAPGTIFWANEHYAVGTMERDSAYDVERRVVNVAETLGRFESQHVAMLMAAFGTQRPVTTRGSGQVLIVVGDFWASGLMFVGTGTEDRGNYIGVDPGVLEMPMEQPLYFQENVVFHELAHAFQDRYAMELCVESAGADCGWDMWGNAWAVEGGADLLTQHMMRIDMGYDATGNYPTDGPVANALGLLTYYGTLDSPHFVFTEGYSSSSWLLDAITRDLVARGVPFEQAIGAVAVGAFEGWYGHGDAGAKRPGLVERVSALRGESFEPVDAALRGLMALAADDRTSFPELQVPFLQRAWEWMRPAATFELDGTTHVDATLIGLGFAHYRIVDEAGLGGTLEIGTGIAPLEWAVVRLK